MEARLQKFQQRVEDVVTKMAQSASESLKGILPQIQSGAEIGQEQAKGKAEWWGKSANSKHHATYAAIVRRHGRWSEKGHDWPGEAAEPIYESFAKEWFDFFAPLCYTCTERQPFHDYSNIASMLHLSDNLCMRAAHAEQLTRTSRRVGVKVR